MLRAWSILIVVICFVMVLSGCGKKQAAGPKTDSPDDAIRDRLEPGAAIEMVDTNDSAELEFLEDASDVVEDLDQEMISAEVVSVESPVQCEEMEISPAQDMEAAAVHVELADFGVTRAPRNDLMGAYPGTGLSGRGSADSQALQGDRSERLGRNPLRQQ